MSKGRPKGSTNKKEKIKEPIYFLKIIVNNEVYEATGDDLKELMNDFNPPRVIKNETNFVAIKGNKTVQRDLKVNEARRIFGNKTSMLLFTNNLISQLG